MDLLWHFWMFASIFLIGHQVLIHFRILKPITEKANDSGGVSVIVCARNEASNLRQNLPLILQQDFQQFEVVVVNDRSNDDSKEVLSELGKRFNKLKVIHLNEDDGYIGKKKALSIGIEQAHFPKLLLTDADCSPVSPNWIQYMTSALEQKEVVLGFGAYNKSRNWISKLIRWETLQTAIQYFSFAKLGLPYMGVGRNLAYNKSLFQNSTGFKSHLEIPSGDDDLFVSENASSNNVALCWNKESFTYSDGPSSLNEWWRQKRRHMSTAGSYRLVTKFVLALYGFFQLMFYLLLPFMLIHYGFDQNFWLLLTVKFTTQLIVLIPMSKRFESREVLWLFPIWEFMVTIMLAIILVQNSIFGKPKAWK